MLLHNCEHPKEKEKIHDWLKHDLYSYFHNRWTTSQNEQSSETKLLKSLHLFHSIFTCFFLLKLLTC